MSCKRIIRCAENFKRFTLACAACTCRQHAERLSANWHCVEADACKENNIKAGNVSFLRQRRSSHRHTSRLSYLINPISKATMPLSNEVAAPAGQRNYIALLPVEILSYVFEYALELKTDFVNQQWLEPDGTNKAAHKLAMVNRHFNVAATPYLYRCLEIDMQSRAFHRQIEETKMLRDTLHPPKTLGLCIRAFSTVAIDATSWVNDGSALLPLKVLERAVNLSYFRLIENFSTPSAITWRLIQDTLKRLTSLRHLHLYDTEHRLPVDRIVAALRGYSSKLTELTLHGRAPRNADGPLIPEQVIHPLSLCKETFLETCS